MELKIEELTGIGEYQRKEFLSKKGEHEGELFVAPNDKIFLVQRKNTIEVRTDKNLSKISII